MLITQACHHMVYINKGVGNMKMRHNYKRTIKAGVTSKNNINSANKRRKSVKASYGGWGKFYGLNDVEFTVPNDTDDPTIYYNGKYYNYYAVEDTLWDYYKDECNENGVIPDEADFENWVSNNSYYVYDILDELSPKSEPGRGVYRDEPNTLRGPIKSSRMTTRHKTVNASKIMAAMDISNLKIYVPSYCYVDVMVDDYEQGEGEQVNSWAFDVSSGAYNSAQELIDDIAGRSGIFSNNIADYVVLDSSLQTDATVNNDNEIPSEAEWEAWKRGELELFVAHLWVNLQVGSETHDITDDEAEGFGFSIY